MLRNLAENVRCRIWRNLAESGAWLPLWLEKLGKLEKLEKGCFLEKKLEKLEKNIFFSHFQLEKLEFGFCLFSSPLINSFMYKIVILLTVFDELY